MSEVGYTDNKAFREVFKITGVLPLDYRAKYAKEISLAQRMNTACNRSSRYSYVPPVLATVPVKFD
ncbi:hypothetical protein SAMN05216167_101693 [Spirosoma endophyticum]|uniref:Uncharacterized protein n=1 Tax=Spirosoma endophyticum TaxID=662367 RepID=A0A1I1HFN0_9BACT|nr:hypothetical protein SAMN05216167_101693 [Spirosoma endophyticum]